MDSPLDGELVRLRAADEGTIRALTVLTNDPELIPLALAGIFPAAEAARVAWWRGMVEAGATFFIIERIADARPLGLANLRDFDTRRDNAGLGIWIGKPFWDQGFGKDAVRTLCRYAFDDMHVRSIYLDVRADNSRAIAAYRAVGFSEEGLLREHTFADGAYRDMLGMAITRPELQGA